MEGDCVVVWYDGCSRETDGGNGQLLVACIGFRRGRNNEDDEKNGG
jgi:hypothetical protein